MPSRRLRRPLRPAYKGKLAEPLTRRDEPSEEERDEFNRTAHERMDLLLDHYGIDRSDPERWHSLAILLAVNHVPCFLKTRSGTPASHRPRSWTEEVLRDLWLRVERKLDSRECDSPLQACERLASEEPFKRFGARGKRPAPSTLLRRYREFASTYPGLIAILNQPLD